MPPSANMLELNRSLHEYIQDPDNTCHQSALKKVYSNMRVLQQKFPPIGDDVHSRMKFSRAIEAIQRIEKDPSLSNIEFLVERMIDVLSTLSEEEEEEATKNSALNQIGVGCSKNHEQVLEALDESEQMFKFILVEMIKCSKKDKSDLKEEEQQVEAIRKLFDVLKPLEPFATNIMENVKADIEEKFFSTVDGKTTLKEPVDTIIESVQKDIPFNDIFPLVEATLQEWESKIFAKPQQIVDSKSKKRKHFGLDVGDYAFGLYSPGPVKKRRRNKTKPAVYEEMKKFCKDSPNLTLAELKGKSAVFKDVSIETMRNLARFKDPDNSTLQIKKWASKKKWTEAEEEILLEAIHNINDTSPAKIEKYCKGKLDKKQQQIQDKIKHFMEKGKLNIEIEWEGIWEEDSEE